MLSVERYDELGLSFSFLFCNLSNWLSMQSRLDLWTSILAFSICITYSLFLFFSCFLSKVVYRVVSSSIFFFLRFLISSYNEVRLIEFLFDPNWLMSYKNLTILWLVSLICLSVFAYWVCLNKSSLFLWFIFCWVSNSCCLRFDIIFSCSPFFSFNLLIVYSKLTFSSIDSFCFC